MISIKPGKAEHKDTDSVQELKTFDQKFILIFSAFLLFITLILFFPYWFTRYYWFDIDFSNTGEIGDTMGGILGPFIGIGAAILTFLAFWVQYKANEQQKLDLRIERFENKFYELLKIHKANVDEMNISDRFVGRKCFVPMFYEFRFCFHLVEDFYKSTSDQVREAENYNGINLLSLAYTIFFFGIGIHSEKHFKHNLNPAENHLFERLKPFLLTIQNRYDDFKKRNPNDKYFPLAEKFTDLPKDVHIELYYYPFDGHMSRLAHYYRHLFQTMGYITNQNFTTDKYSYVKMLRAQLSNFEQLLLYYNALAWFDGEWREYFTVYRLIKNLPLPLADIGERPETHFAKEIEELRKKGLEMFELHE